MSTDTDDRAPRNELEASIDEAVFRWETARDNGGGIGVEGVRAYHLKAARLMAAGSGEYRLDDGRRAALTLDVSTSAGPIREAGLKRWKAAREVVAAPLLAAVRMLVAERAGRHWETVGPAEVAAEVGRAAELGVSAAGRP